MPVAAAKKRAALIALPAQKHPPKSVHIHHIERLGEKIFSNLVPLQTTSAAAPANKPILFEWKHIRPSTATTRRLEREDATQQLHN